MATTPRRVLAVILVTFAGFFLAAPASTAVPMFGCLASISFVASLEGEPHPAEHEIKLALTQLPGYVPLVTQQTGYDYCVYYQRHPFDQEAAPFDEGTISAAAYRLNQRGKWRRLVRVSGVQVENNGARGCRNSKKKIIAGETLRWVVKLEGLPALGYYDFFQVDVALVTGGAGVATGSETSSFSRLR